MADWIVTLTSDGSPSTMRRYVVIGVTVDEALTVVSREHGTMAFSKFEVAYIDGILEPHLESGK
jgi:hypothetical protein